MKKFYSLAIFAVITNLLLTNTSFGQTNTWDGSGGANWNTASSWSLNHVPLLAEDVVIPNGITTTITVNTTAVCNSFTMNGGGTNNTVSISGTNSLTVTNAISIGAGTGTFTSKTLAVGTGSLSCASLTIAATGSFLRSSAVTLSTGTVSVTGNITMGDANDDFTFSGAGTLNVGGSMSGGTFTASTGTVNYNGSSAQSIANYTYYNLTLSGAGAKTLGGNRTITGNLLISAGTTLSLGTNNLTIDVNAARSVTINGVLDIDNTGDLLENQNSIKTLIINNGGLVRLSNTASTFPALNAQTFNTGSTVEYSASNGTGAQTVSGYTYSNLTLAGTGTKTLGGNATVNATLSMQGTAVLAVGASTLTYGAASTLEYAGSSVQTTTSVEFKTPGGPFNLRINNSNGVTLHAARSISGALTLTNGILTTTTNLLTMNAGSTTSGASNASFVNGQMAKTGSTAFTFPVGKTGTGYQPLGISNLSGSTTFTAEYIRASGAAKGSSNGPLQLVSACEHWMLYGSSAVAADVTLYWNANSPCGGAGYINGPFPNPFLRIARYNGASGSTWSNASNTNSQDPANSVASGNMTASLASAAFTNPTFFTFGTTNSANSPLPVMYANVKAYGKNNGVQIEWSNLTERDLTGYDIERSANGTNFTPISHQQPKNNLNDKADYTEFDAAPLQGTNFYRIKANEIGGKVIYSKILRVEIGNTVKLKFTIYPNPVTGNQVTIGLNNVKQGQYTLRVVNVSGVDVFKQTITSQGSSMTETVQLPASVKPGVYNMLISGGDYRESKIFVIQ